MRRITEKCTNCGACLHSCPLGAISFKKVGIRDVAMIDEKKCINCGMCHKLCPGNQKREKNKVIIKVGRIKDQTAIMKSTSGGLFGEIARYILGINGIVYGAVYENNYKEVYHTRCDNIEDLDSLLKSKYVRSDLRNTFEEAKQDLENDNKVLFSGTPCQIAGLKAYLQKDYKNLYTIDIVCHGTPEPSVWKKYATYREQQEKSIITKVDFRHFEKQDPSRNFYIQFENGKESKEVLYDTSYGRAFLIGMINTEGCSTCKFNNFKQESDITLGDAWGYINPKYPTKNSLIFINTPKGKFLYSKIKDNIIEFNNFNFKEMLANCYPIIHPTFAHSNANRVNIHTQDINKELWYWLDEKNGLIKDKKGVGILNFHYENYNYGANLVAYSLSKVIEKIGYNPYVINFDPFDDLDPITRYQTMNLLKFRQKHLNMTPRFKNQEDLKALNDALDMYVVGSDQVWRKTITQKNLFAYFFEFAENKNKISYAASFGKDCFEGDAIEAIHCAKLLSSFYSISVRENDALEILQNKFKTKGIVTLDPTLLLTSDDYNEIIDDSYEKPFDVGVYFVMDHDNIITSNNYLLKLFPKKTIVNIKGEFVQTPFGKIFKYNSVSKWIDGFRKANIIVTDSYHGLIFGIIYRKKVICIGKNSTSLSRFKTLIDNLSNSIEDVMYASLKDVKDVNKSLNYKEIEKNVEKMKKTSINFLRENLGTNKIKKEDSFFQYIDESTMKYHEMEDNLQETIDELNRIKYSRSWKITKPLRDLKWMVTKK